MSVHPDDLSARYYALALQGRYLVGAYRGLQSLADFIFQIELPNKEREAFLEHRERAYAALTRHIGCLDICEKQRKHHIWSEKQLVAKALDLLKNAKVNYSESYTGDVYDETLEIDDSAEDEYDRISDFIDEKLDIAPSAIVVLAWIAFIQAEYEALCEAYEAYRIALQDFDSYYNWDHFHVTKRDWKTHYLDLVYGNKKGSTEYSVAMRATLQGFCFNAFQNRKLDDVIAIGSDGGRVTMRLFFQQSQYCEAFGYLKEYPKPEFNPLTQLWRARFGITKNLVVSPALQALIRETVKARPLEIEVSPLTSFKSPIQVMSSYHWQSGELSGKVKLFPGDFEYAASPLYNGSNILLGSQGSGKTTLETSIDYCSIEEKDMIVLFPLDDPLNWPELASLPSMDIPNNSVYDFLTKKLHVRPKGVPVLMLNIVDSLDKLKRVQMTKYDRILKVGSGADFEVDFDWLLEELRVIGEDYGKKKPVGIIAVRNLRDTVLDEKKDIVEADVFNAARFLLSFQRWRQNNAGVKMRITWDEVRNMNQISTKGQAKIKYCHDQLLSAARREQTPLDYGTDKLRDTSFEIRETVQNVFFGRLAKEAQEAKSPIDILLGGLEIDEAQIEAVKRLTSSGYLAPENHLMVWHDKAKPGVLELASPMPAPFQTQIVNMPNNEIKKVFVKSLRKNGKESEADSFFKRVEQVPLMKAYSGDSEDSEGITEDLITR